MIENFADQGTADVFHGLASKAARRCLPAVLWPVARRKLDMLHAAYDIQDLRVPPGNRLEPLKGSLAGRWSIRVNDQYRVVFRFSEHQASEVQIADYH